MADLTGSTISSSYDMLLKTATTGGVTSTLKVIEDGLGVDSALKLSTTDVSVNGSLGVGLSGTDTPDQPLHILSTVDQKGFKVVGVDGMTTELLPQSSESSPAFGTTSEHNFRLIADNATAVTIDTFQNVGIGGIPASVSGAGSPVLDIRGSVPEICLTDTDADKNDWYIRISDGLQFGEGTDSRVYFENGGKVGIGTVPSEALEVKGSPPSIKATASNAGGQAEIKLFGGDYASNDSDKRAIVSDGDLTFRRHNGSEWENDLTIDSSGNVNIGSAVLDLGTDANGVINADAGMRINIDADGGATGETFTVGKDQRTAAATNILFQVREDGNVLMPDLPDADPGIAGALYHSSGTVMISL